MSRVIENRLKTVLALKKKPSGKAFNKAFDAVWDIGELGRQKKHRAQATAALKAIVEHGVMASSAWINLSNFVTSDDEELVRAHMRDPDCAYECMSALIRLFGRDVYGEAVDMVCDGHRDGNTRLSILVNLSEHSGYPFDAMVTEDVRADEVTGDDLPLDELQRWRDASFPKYVEPKIELPTRQLKKSGIALPDDYATFLLKHSGKDRLEFDDQTWDLATAARLFEPVDVDGKEYPRIRVLQGYVKGLRRSVEQGATEDAKGKPYPLDRLADGFAVGTSDSGDVLYLDPADGHSCWIYHHDGGDVEKVGKSFAAWKRKARKAWD